MKDYDLSGSPLEFPKEGEEVLPWAGAASCGNDGGTGCHNAGCNTTVCDQCTDKSS